MFFLMLSILFANSLFHFIGFYSIFIKFVSLYVTLCYLYIVMQVYQQSIAAVCNLDWPKGHMLVQVLDDSDDVEMQFLIVAEVQKWQQKGVHIVYRHRVVRCSNLIFVLSSSHITLFHQ